jgi:hypothetical protein
VTMVGVFELGSGDQASLAVQPERASQFPKKSRFSRSDALMPEILQILGWLGLCGVAEPSDLVVLVIALVVVTIVGGRRSAQAGGQSPVERNATNRRSSMRSRLKSL